MQSKKPTISRDRVAEAIWENVLNGTWEPGQRIVEATLAAEVGVSRTPVREALLGLHKHGIVEHAHGSGFRVRDFSAQELQEIYPIRAILETAAIRLACGHFGPDVRRLNEITSKIREIETTPIDYANADAEWHQVVVADCRNETLLTILEQLRRQSMRYEIAYFRSDVGKKRSFDQLDEIVRAINAGEVDEACDLLRQHLIDGIHPVLDWLRNRES